MTYKRCSMNFMFTPFKILFLILLQKTTVDLTLMIACIILSLTLLFNNKHK